MKAKTFTQRKVLARKTKASYAMLRKLQDEAEVREVLLKDQQNRAKNPSS